MDLDPEQIATLVNQLSQLVKDIAAASDPVKRETQVANLVLQAKKTIWAIQEPRDAIMDQVIGTSSVAAALTLVQIGVFDLIPPKGTAAAKQIARHAEVEEELIVRLMRQLTCVNIFVEVSQRMYSHNRLSIALSTHFESKNRDFYLVAMEEMLPSVLAATRHIRQHGSHSLLHTYTHTLHSSFNNMCGRNFWDILNSCPQRMSTFMSGLSMWNSMHPVMAIFPFSEALAVRNDENRTLAVDIGGGRGTAMLELRKSCPKLKVALVLQDRACVLDEVWDKDLPGVEKMAHDFFTPQPVKSAQVYYIRRVLHDWQDADAAHILQNIVPAMAKDSRILVSDMARPELVTAKDAGAVSLDIMMLAIGGKERTKKDWKALGEMSGLKTVRIWQDVETLGPLCVGGESTKTEDVNNGQETGALF